MPSTAKKIHPPIVVSAQYPTALENISPEMARRYLATSKGNRWGRHE
ncbi:MAG: hypothetical protein QMD46_12375 [Methanomicrobiales archaeon]|nr:hypothetical protein [Methanomicrobiales archaeon]